MARLTSSDRPASIRYKKLTNLGSDIRVLEIQPASRLDDAVVSRLITISPNKSNIEIIGLSSLIGDLEATEIIYVDGKPIRTTSYLAQGLRHTRDVFLSESPYRQDPHPVEVPRPKTRLPQRLRKLLGMPQQVIHVWIDSLCINQWDTVETDHRKETMKLAYLAAKTVLGWLGPKIDSTDVGLTVFTQIDDCMPRFWGDPGDMEMHPENYSPTHEWAKGMKNLWQDSDDGCPPFMMPHWIGANDFMYRSYFQKQCTYLSTSPRDHHVSGLSGNRPTPLLPFRPFDSQSLSFSFLT